MGVFSGSHPPKKDRLTQKKDGKEKDAKWWVATEEAETWKNPASLAFPSSNDFHKNNFFFWIFLFLLRIFVLPLSSLLFQANKRNSAVAGSDRKWVHTQKEPKHQKHTQYIYINKPEKLFSGRYIKRISISLSVFPLGFPWWYNFSLFFQFSPSSCSYCSSEETALR